MEKDGDNGSRSAAKGPAFLLGGWKIDMVNVVDGLFVFVLNR